MIFRNIKNIGIEWLTDSHGAVCINEEKTVKEKTLTGYEVKSFIQKSNSGVTVDTIFVSDDTIPFLRADVFWDWYANAKITLFKLPKYVAIVPLYIKPKIADTETIVRQISADVAILSVCEEQEKSNLLPDSYLKALENAKVYDILQIDPIFNYFIIHGNFPDYTNNLFSELFIEKVMLIYFIKYPKSINKLHMDLNRDLLDWLLNKVVNQFNKIGNNLFFKWREVDFKLDLTTNRLSLQGINVSESVANTTNE